ncbi:hypothetical protein CRG98_001920 [Punica granatum]|uniref:Uncharacterized protein n=1 Tax=Punica granatum TaxID=22663 RepID=A0A2I0LAK4_PUNGR|nr:hypothetical protein CRG98_001920 [Punica granatum]
MRPSRGLELEPRLRVEPWALVGSWKSQEKLGPRSVMRVPSEDLSLVVSGRRPLAREDLGTCDWGFLSVLRMSRGEVFVTTETSLGRPSRVPKGHLKLVPRPRWSLGACRPVSGCCLLVNGAGLPEPLSRALVGNPLSGPVDQNGVLTACPSLIACSIRGGKVEVDIVARWHFGGAGRGGWCVSEPKSCLCHARRHSSRFERESSCFPPFGPFTRLRIATCYMGHTRVRRGEDASQDSRPYLLAEKRKPTKDVSRTQSTRL